MENINYIVIFLAAFIGGALNAVAGGGGFIAYPSLIFCNIAPLNANGISTVALWSGNITSAIAFKRDIRLPMKFIVYFVLAISLGGGIGAYLFLKTRTQVFSSFVPFFLLITWLLFVFSNSLRNYFLKNIKPFNFIKPRYNHIFFMFLIGIYGGYFGAGLGMIILTVFSLIGLKNINEMNGIKVILVSFNNGIAALTYIISGIIFWQYTLIMISGSLIGGFYGAKLAQRIKQENLRYFIICIGAIVTGLFFINQYLL